MLETQRGSGLIPLETVQGLVGEAQSHNLEARIWVLVGVLLFTWCDLSPSLNLFGSLSFFYNEEKGRPRTDMVLKYLKI